MASFPVSCNFYAIVIISSYPIRQDSLLLLKNLVNIVVDGYPLHLNCLVNHFQWAERVTKDGVAGVRWVIRKDGRVLPKAS